MAGSGPNSSQRLGGDAPSSAGASSSEGASGALDGATQKLPPVDAAASAAERSAETGDPSTSGRGPERAAARDASLDVSGKAARSGSLSGGLSKGVSGDASPHSGSVASRRLAHGLSPEATAKADAAELRRKEKEASAEDRKRKFQRQHKAKMVRRALIAVAVVLVAGVVFGFWLLRWGLYDDASSIQGQWRVKGTDTVINITDEDIVLTDEVAYDYVIDPDAKTLAFTFGGLTGNGRYRFSLDHSQLAIDDGEFDWGSTLVADIPWTFDAVAQKLVGHPEKSPSLGQGDMVLERM